MKDLDEARREINLCDKEIADLFTRRMRAVGDVAAYKAAHGLPIFDAAREDAVIAQNAEKVPEDLRPFYVSFLRDMMRVSKRYQSKLIEGLRVAYSGVPGAFAEIAAKKIFPAGTPVPFGSFADAYAAVENGKCDVAVLPIENSYAGEVGAVLDLMFCGSLFVNGVYNLKVSHCLVGVPGATKETVRRVFSHPQALDQCAPYLQKNGFAATECSNTARAAKEVSEKNDPAIAAIASEETAALYGLSILEKNINEAGENTTRFAVFSRSAQKSAPQKHTAFILLFTVNHIAGALAKAINVLGAYGYNMRVLRSRPMKNHSWQYYFYVEAEGDETSPDGERMLRQLAAHCDLLRVVGHFTPDAEPPKGEI